MNYFRRRNKLVEEFSGFEDASENLRLRLSKIFDRYVARGGYMGVGQENLWVSRTSLEHELYVEMTKGDLSQILLHGSYDEVFTTVEIFLHLAKEQASGRYRRVILPEIIRAFDLSGSVYFVDGDEGQVNLRVDQELAAKLKEAEDLLEKNKTAYTRFFEAVGNLMGRKDSPQNVVKDLFIAFEDFLKEETDKKDFGQAISFLAQEGLITSTQRALLDKIYAYRSDSYGATHAGKSAKPDEIDALWFLETVIAQLKLIERRLSSYDKS